MTDSVTYVHDLSTPHRQPSRTLTEGATLDLGRRPTDERTRLFAERLTLDIHCRLHGTAHGLRVDCGSRTEGLWLFTVAHDALEDPRAALEPVTFDDLTASILTTTADGALVRFIRCANVILEVPVRLGVFTHHTGPRFDQPRPLLEALPEVRTPAMLFVRGHAYHLDPPVAPPPITGNGGPLRRVPATRALQTPRTNVAPEPAPRDAQWIVQGDATGAPEFHDRAETFERWLRERARADAFLLRRCADGTLTPCEVVETIDADGRLTRTLRALIARASSPPQPADGRWPGWFISRASLPEAPPDDAVARAVTRYREMFSGARDASTSPHASLLDLVRDELGAIEPATLVWGWMQAARLASSTDAMTLASALWLMSCIALPRLDELDATEVALLVAAALHLLGEPTMPALPGASRILPRTLGGSASTPAQTTVPWSRPHLDALTRADVHRLDDDAVRAFERDPLAMLKDLDGRNHRLRAVTAHALIYATLAPSRARDDGREFYLRPEVALRFDTMTVSAIERAIGERRYMESSKVTPFLKRWSHKRPWLSGVLAAWKRCSFDGYELHARRTAAWLRAAKEHCAEGLARVIDKT